MSDHHACHLLPADAGSVVLARRAMNELGLAPLRTGKVKLIVSELVTNSVEHGRLGPEDHIEVRAHLDDSGSLRVEVLDDGPGPPVLTQGGLGWRVIERVADRWGVERTGPHACVWFELDAGP
ncbi:MAG: serine/threonine-protein kinase RsbW [Solirubrobacteraceae bacterium]|jgi:anti-sigma regulatory factor (Ser/Thr protein kinase)|nr:serine/threonine-protein kinase RsbW [Solirubrobacteraceae bacterium]MEA2394029.1 serine/threonine-protein kinase RsbW [Solirubrobacteraceae bacterium]